MKYLVISTRRDNSFEAMTVCAEVEDNELAKRLMTYYNKTDKGQHSEVHPVMNDAEVKEFLKKYDKEPYKEKTAMEKFNEYIYWLQQNSFGSEMMNGLAYEIGSAMSSIYRYGCDYYDEEAGDYGWFHVDQQNPDTRETFYFALNGIKEDRNLLLEYGITTGKPTKKYPVNVNDVNWNAFINDNMF